MDRGAWRTTFHGVARVGHDLGTKLPPPQYTIFVFPLLHSAQEARGNLLCDTGSSTQGSVTTERGGMAWETGGRIQREGTFVYL